MLILAFDTTGDRGGAGIFRDAECLASLENEGRSNFSVALFQIVERLLAETQLNLSDIELFAVANGPGSFTGIRVGVAAAQGWARAFSRPVCGVSVLAAMTRQAQPETEWAASILDARRGEFYLGLFQRVCDPVITAQASYEPQGEGWVLKPGPLAEMLKPRRLTGAGVTCLVREHEQAALSLRAILPDSFRWQTVWGLLLPAIARLALEAHGQGRLQSPAELDARYIRRSDAELHWRD